MNLTLAETPLHGWHTAHGAKMAEFGGWSMPIQYGSIVDEHHATRRAVGLFDISHMGRLVFRGDAAGPFLDHLLTRPVSQLGVGRVRYALLTNAQGGTIDDVLVSRLEDREGPFFLMVVNAGNLQKVTAWIESNRSEYADKEGSPEFEDRTLQQAMLAVQGPQAGKVLAEVCDGDLAGMGYYTAQCTEIDAKEGIVSRTGYTGEDGWELVVPAAHAETLWKRLFQVAGQLGGTCVGLAARDTLRLEAAMPLYGHELDEDISPLQAGLGFAVQLEGNSFVGRDAMVQVAKQQDYQCRVGLVSSGRRAPREGYPVLVSGRRIGSVTSGTHSPTLGLPIAMAYVDREFSDVGTEVSIDMRGREERAEVVELPFYRRGDT